MKSKELKVPQLRQDELQRYVSEFGRMPIETNWNFDEKEIERHREIVWYDLDLTWEFKSVRFSEYRDTNDRIYIYPIIKTKNHVYRVIVSKNDEQIGYIIDKPYSLYPTPLLGKIYLSPFAQIWLIIFSCLLLYVFALYDSSIIKTFVLLVGFIGLYIQWMAIYRVLRTYSLCCRHHDLSQFSAIKLRLFSRERHGDMAKKLFLTLLIVILCNVDFFLNEEFTTFIGIFTLLLIGSLIIAINLGAPYMIEDFPPENEQKNIKLEQTIHYLIASAVTCLWILITKLYFCNTAYAFINSLDIHLLNGFIVDISSSIFLSILFVLGKIIIWYSIPGFLMGGLIRLGLMLKKNKYLVDKNNV